LYLEAILRDTGQKAATKGAIMYNEQFIRSILAEIKDIPKDDLEYIARLVLDGIQSKYPQINHATEVHVVDVAKIYYDQFQGNVYHSEIDLLDLELVAVPRPRIDRPEMITVHLLDEYFEALILYDPMHDRLYMGNVYFARYRPRRISAAHVRHSSVPQCCPRCGCIDIACHGAKLPRWLRVKDTVVCKKCGHTARSKEFNHATAGCS
jgi:hypothetical protein